MNARVLFAKELLVMLCEVQVAYCNTKESHIYKWTI